MNTAVAQEATISISIPNLTAYPFRRAQRYSVLLHSTEQSTLAGHIMKMKTVEIPDFYLHDVAEKGVDFMDEYYNVIPGAADRYIYATNIVNSKSGDDLIQFIAEMLLAYDALKYRDRG